MGLESQSFFSNGLIELSFVNILLFLFVLFYSTLPGLEGIGLEGYAFGCAGLGLETARTGGIWGAGFFTEAWDRQGHKEEKGQIGADWKQEGGEFSL